jgi:hypothetical protein
MKRDGRTNSSANPKTTTVKKQRPGEKKILPPCAMDDEFNVLLHQKIT